MSNRSRASNSCLTMGVESFAPGSTDGAVSEVAKSPRTISSHKEGRFSKPGGWPAWCGVVFRTQKDRTIHRRTCETCKTRRREIRSETMTAVRKNYPEETRVQLKGRILAFLEVAENTDVASALALGPNLNRKGGRHAKEGGWLTFCGLTMPTKPALQAHRATCGKCQERGTGRPQRTIGWQSLCGLIFATCRQKTSHHKSCSVCKARRRQIRSETMTAVREKYPEEVAANVSATAKRTSARLDIQAARAERLRRWREENPEAFNVIVERLKAAPKGLGFSPTKLEEAAKAFLPEDVERAVHVEFDGRTKCVDFRSGNLLVEVDGIRHFIPLNGEKAFVVTQASDVALCDWVMRERSVALVRISTDCFEKCAVREKWAPMIRQAITEARPGVTLVGDLYFGVRLAYDRWWTSRWDLPITSVLPMG